MPATFVSGNLFEAPELDAIGHGCNCAGAMGKGIAVEFKKRFPAMYREYKQRCADGAFGLGDVFFWEDGDTRVFNLGTQKTWRSGAVMSAIESSVERMLAIAEERGVGRIGLPRIGAGLGGLKWSEVRHAIETKAAASKVELVVFEHFVP